MGSGRVKECKIFFHNDLSAKSCRFVVQSVGGATWGANASTRSRMGNRIAGLAVRRGGGRQPLGRMTLRGAGIAGCDAGHGPARDQSEPSGRRVG